MCFQVRFTGFFKRAKESRYSRRVSVVRGYKRKLQIHCFKLFFSPLTWKLICVKKSFRKQDTSGISREKENFQKKKKKLSTPVSVYFETRSESRSFMRRDIFCWIWQTAHDFCSGKQQKQQSCELRVKRRNWFFLMFSVSSLGRSVRHSSNSSHSTRACVFYAESAKS